MVPYLKGIHLTLDSWREGRTKSGWKVEVATQAATEDDDPDGYELTNAIDDKLLPRELSEARRNPDAPAFVSPVPRLIQDIEALTLLTRAPEPPAVQVRPTQVIVGYLVGDASGMGHGCSFLHMGEETLNLSYGTWSEEATNRSSNFRELANLVQ